MWTLYMLYQHTLCQTSSLMLLVLSAPQTYTLITFLHTQSIPNTTSHHFPNHTTAGHSARGIHATALRPDTERDLLQPSEEDL